jgi:CCR4-NOT transcription complex subunit 1
MPDETDRSLMIWRCLELVDVLFKLGENTGLSQTIYQLFRSPGPISKCPDVFGLAIVQLTSPLTQFRLYILKQVIVQLIASHANAVPVLNFIWNNESNAENLRTLALNCFSEYYTNSDDQNRLTRILEVAHELKPNGLGELFNLPQYKFAIDLACLAARRDFLKLDKFLDDKLNENGVIKQLFLIYSYFRSHLQSIYVNFLSGKSHQKAMLCQLTLCRPFLQLFKPELLICQ